LAYSVADGEEGTDDPLYLPVRKQDVSLSKKGLEERLKLPSGSGTGTRGRGEYVCPLERKGAGLPLSFSRRRQLA